MNIELKNLIDVLTLFNITVPISDFNFFINGYDENSHAAKIIVKVDFVNRTPVVVKFVSEENHPHDVIEAQSAFSEHLRENGIITPRRFKASNQYCVHYQLNNISLDVTIEDYFGENIKVIDFKLAYKIGQLMAKIHYISQRDNLHINADTIFNIIGYNEVSGYDDFIKLGENNKINPILYHNINLQYVEKLKKIKSSWSGLPRYATQGDFSINNLAFVGEELGIFDYNIAGDETLIGDLICEGLLVANEMDLADGLTNTDKVELFRHFVDGYVSKRPLTDSEKNVYNDIYAITASLWFTKIKYNENSLTKLIELNENDKVDLLLQQIYHTLSNDSVEL